MKRLRDLLVAHAVDPLCIAGFDGKFRQLNPAWTRTLGWSESELNSQPWMEFVHPADHDATAVAGEKLMRGELLPGFRTVTVVKTVTTAGFHGTPFLRRNPEQSSALFAM